MSERYEFEVPVNGSSRTVIPDERVSVKFETVDGIPWAVIERRVDLDGRPALQRRRVPAWRLMYRTETVYVDEAKSAKAAKGAKGSEAAQPA